MKIQGLAVIAIIIILPMTMILNSYAKNQIKTLDLQIQYDSKLKNATYDAIKTFQLNMSNSSTSDLVNSKMRDINASINTFYQSLSSHFSMYGYHKEVLQNYVPAVVYTLYDGYYIHSAYTNTLDENDQFDEQATYQNGETIYGLKPYIYYSCRYKPDSIPNTDFVINYSLDSYITIQGRINGKTVNESGYLLSSVKRNKEGTITYKGFEILIEESNKLQQNVYVKGNNNGKKPIEINDNVVGSISSYPCKKVNGVKYYQESDDHVFAIINDEKYDQPSVKSIMDNQNGRHYYEEALTFKSTIESLGIKNLTSSDAVDAYGNKYTDNEKNTYDHYSKFKELFSDEGTDIEDSNSNFNAHKMQVIKNSIESNLIPAISNYNEVSTSDVNFAMPRLQDYEWEQLAQNVSMITFLQGLNIGGKIYSGYAIISNNNNEDYVSEESIYISDGNEYYRVTQEGLENKNISELVGIFNLDFERKSTNVSDGQETQTKTIYYYPREEMESYHLSGNQNIHEYFKDAERQSNRYRLAQIYYTALGRERYGMYRVTNKLENIQRVLENP